MRIEYKTIKACLIIILGILITTTFQVIKVEASENYNSKVFYNANSTMINKDIDELLFQYNSIFVIYNEQVNKSDDDLQFLELNIGDENQMINKTISLLEIIILRLKILLLRVNCIRHLRFQKRD